MKPEDYLRNKKRIIDNALDRYLPSSHKPPRKLHQAMRYSVFAGGKRIRPILAMAAYELVGGKGNSILPVACALELIHTYSLIHDDLPCMDDDDLRRGKPTCHRVFGYGMAVLAGDALHALAFELLAKSDNPKIVVEVANSIGTVGMVGGQAADLEAEGKKVNLKEVNFIHIHKTAALLRACIRVGAILGKANSKQLKALTSYGNKFGLAFQITDDILDLEGEERKLGKRVGVDKDKAKATYPKVIGVERSKQEAKRLVQSAKKDLKSFKKTGILKQLADFLISRTN
ncbi:MAG TPA: farnesyl diphosphate synthase [candidate division Zixibacteria bacterium]